MTLAAPVVRRPALPNLKPYRRLSWIIGGLGAAALVAAIAGGPDLRLLFIQPLVIQLHVYAAVSAFVLGTVIVLARKGKRFHRTAGWTWVILMALTAGASLFIVGLNGDKWSWIHGLSGATLAGLPFGVLAARRHKVKDHQRQMMGLYLGGMVIAGAFTFIPGRLMWDIFFS